MKKTAVACLAMACALSMGSRVWASGAGLKAGFSLAQIHETSTVGALDWRGLPFVAGGLTFDGGWGMLTLVPEIFYVQQGGKFMLDSANGLKNRYHYIQVPLQLKLEVIPGGMVRPFFAGGAYGAFLLRAESFLEIDGVTTKANVTSDFDRWDWGVVGSAGLIFRSSAMSVSIEGRYNHGLLNILKGAAPGDSIKNRCWMALIGIWY